MAQAIQQYGLLTALGNGVIKRMIFDEATITRGGGERKTRRSSLKESDQLQDENRNTDGTEQSAIAASGVELAL